MTIEEIRALNIEGITARVSAIAVEMRAEGADINALSAEMDALEERRAAIKAEEEKRRALAQRVATGAAGTVVQSMQRLGGAAETEQERRARVFAETGKMSTRALLSTGKIAKPTAAAGISELAAVGSGIVDDVNAVPLSGVGAWVVAYKKTNAKAADVTDGQDVGGTASTYDYVTINPAEWGVLDQISKQVKKLSPLAYQQAIENSALIALRETAAEKIVDAVLASELAQARTIPLNEKFLRTLMLGFRGVPQRGATCLYIAQEDLTTLGDVRGTNEKKALYEITYGDETNTWGTIKEGALACKFRVLDNLDAGQQLFGQPRTIDMPMWDDYAIETDEGGKYFDKNQIAIRGLQTAGADLVVYHGMQVISQA